MDTTLTGQRPAWRALDQLVSDNPWLPALHITITTANQIRLWCGTAEDFETWRQALGVTAEQVTSTHLDADTIGLHAATSIGGCYIEATVHLPLLRLEVAA